jgi:hypothetical protein
MGKKCGREVDRYRGGNEDTKKHGFLQDSKTAHAPVKFTLEQSTKARWGSRRVALLFL